MQSPPRHSAAEQGANGARARRAGNLRGDRGLASPRLRALAQGASSRSQPEARQENCELCGEPLEARHKHLLDLRTRQLNCTCRACSLLFDQSAAGGGHYRLVGDRRLRLDRFVLDDVVWEELRIPVEMAFFHFNSDAGRVVAFYPSPMGPTESQLELEAWHEIELANPLLSTMVADVEALLVNRTKAARDAWIVPIEDPYRLVAIIRTNWRGFTGGKEVWLEIERFFDELNREAAPGSGLGDPAPGPTKVSTAERR